MTTDKQTAANRRNAQLSTGPTTPAGKAVSAQNAVQHGLCSESPVVAGLESQDDWEAHCREIVESLAPVGRLENLLAQRVALLFWRYERLTRYETAVTAVRLATIDVDYLKQRERANRLLHTPAVPVLEELNSWREKLDEQELSFCRLEKLQKQKDNARITGDEAYNILDEAAKQTPQHMAYFDLDDLDCEALGISDDVNPWNDFDGWNAGLVRGAIEQIAKYAGTQPETLLVWAFDSRKESVEGTRAKVAELDERNKWEQRQRRAELERMETDRFLPDGGTLQNIGRYEAHLTREWCKALHELQRLQGLRSGGDVPAPVVVDVTVDAGQGVT